MVTNPSIKSNSEINLKLFFYFRNFNSGKRHGTKFWADVKIANWFLLLPRAKLKSNRPFNQNYFQIRNSYLTIVQTENVLLYFSWKVAHVQPLKIINNCLPLLLWFLPSAFRPLQCVLLTKLNFSDFLTNGFGYQKLFYPDPRGLSWGLLRGDEVSSQFSPLWRALAGDPFCWKTSIKWAGCSSYH